MVALDKQYTKVKARQDTKIRGGCFIVAAMKHEAAFPADTMLTEIFLFTLLTNQYSSTQRRRRRVCPSTPLALLC